MNKQSSIICFPLGPNKAGPNVFFDRIELQKIMNIYGRMVSAGIWRDYAFLEGQDKIGFSVFQRTSDKADYLILKDPKLAKAQGVYAIIGCEGQVLKRGHNLETLLKYFNAKLLKLVE